MALSIGAYIVGVVELSTIVAALAYGATGVRRWALPGWSGAPARLAEAVLAIALLVWVAEALGAVGILDEWPLLAAVVLAGAGAGLAARGRAPAGLEAREGAPPSPPASRVAWIVAGLAVAMLFAQWAGRTQLSLDRGMYGFDTTWYHMPFAARFAHEGSITALHFTSPAFLSWFYPANSELLHSVGILATGRDLASPVLNLGWLSLALLAAWCVGRPFGVGPASLVGAAVVLGGGVFADQPGEARNDVVGLALLLSAAALLVNGCAAASARGEPGEGSLRLRLGTGPLAVAGLAAGLALGTKLTLGSPVAALTLGVVVAAPAGRRLAMGATWVAALAAAGGFWFARNFVSSGNPLPWITSIGPVSLPGPEEVLPGGREPFSLAHYATDTAVWGEWFFPALADRFGVLWPAILALGALGAVSCLVRGPGEAAGDGRRGGGAPVAALRVAGFAAIAAAIAYPLTPLTASGPEGEPVGFASNLRYLAPVLALSLALLPVAAARSREAWREGGAPLVLAALAICFALALARSDAWDAASPRAGLVAGVAFAVLLCLGAAARAGRIPRAAVAIGVAGALVAALAGGYVEQRRYLDDRYASPSGAISEPGQDSAFAWARDVHGASIGTITIRQYPLYGTELENRVQYVGRRGSDDSFTRIASCPRWRRALNAAGYGYVVTGLNFPTPSGPRNPPEASWTGDDPAATRVLRDGSVSVFRLDGDLDPAEC